MTPETPLQFGRCEVDIAGRSLRVDGNAVAIERRPFDLLVHLIHQRHRVVSKQELLEKVWPGRCVSTGALARAVMKLRQAILDTDATPLIRTVPRVGYRFTGTLTGETGRPAPTIEATTMALLPFENASGDAALDWVELGLMAMVAEALAHERRVSLVGLQPLLGAVAAHPGASLTERVAAVRRDTGAQLVVHGRIARAPGGYRLDFRLHGAPAGSSGSVTAAQPTGLAAGLVPELIRLLFRDVHGAAPSPVRFVDTMAAQAYARGLRMSVEQRWTPALHLFRMALDLEPGHPAVQLGLLRALAPTATDDGEVQALATRLLADAQRDNDPDLAPHVHRIVGFYHRNRRAFDLADVHLRLALELADGRESSDWTARTLLLMCAMSIQRRRLADASGHLDRARALCEHSGDRVLAITVLNLEACLASVEGRHERYVQLSIDCARRARELRRHRDLCDACGNASTGLAELGRLAEAATWAEEGFAAAMVLGDRSSIDDQAMNACIIYRLAGAPHASARLLAELATVQTPVHRPEGIWCARGHHAAASGDMPAAVHCFSTAMQLLRETGFSDLEQDQLPWFIEALILTDRLDDAHAEIAQATPLAAEGNPALLVHLLLLRALLAQRQRQPGAALQFLDQALAAQPAPLWRTWACADAAWLLTEAGDLAAATAWLARIHRALATLPVVLTAQARLRQARAGSPTHDRTTPGAATLPSRRR